MPHFSFVPLGLARLGKGERRRGHLKTANRACLFLLLPPFFPAFGLLSSPFVSKYRLSLSLPANERREGYGRRILYFPTFFLRQRIEEETGKGTFVESRREERAGDSAERRCHFSF